METYIIGFCNRLHDLTPIVAGAVTLISVLFAGIYFESKDYIDRDVETKLDYRLVKVSRIGLICCLVILVISLLLFLFVPTGEEVGLMIK